MFIFEFLIINQLSVVEKRRFVVRNYRDFTVFDADVRIQGFILEKGFDGVQMSSLIFCKTAAAAVETDFSSVVIDQNADTADFLVDKGGDFRKYPRN